MAKVKQYNGVNIYVNENGLFYADAINGSSKFSDKTFHSNKLESIENVIDKYSDGFLNDPIHFYAIEVWHSKMEKISASRKVGSLLFFSDGTTTKENSRKQLYPESIETHDGFKQLQYLFDKLKQLDSKSKEIHLQKQTTRSEIQSILGTMKKVIPQVEVKEKES